MERQFFLLRCDWRTERQERSVGLVAAAANGTKGDAEQNGADEHFATFGRWSKRTET